MNKIKKREYFMKELFIHLPKEIKIKILLTIPSWKPPKPRFKIKNLVRYSLTKEQKFIKVDELFNNTRTINIFHNNSFPYNILKISNNPRWDKNEKNWKYVVLYGPNGRKRKEVNEDEIEFITS